jgi:hypothetical protein
VRHVARVSDPRWQVEDLPYSSSLAPVTHFQCTTGMPPAPLFQSGAGVNLAPNHFALPAAEFISSEYQSIRRVKNMTIDRAMNRAAVPASSA